MQYCTVQEYRKEAVYGVWWERYFGIIDLVIVH